MKKINIIRTKACLLALTMLFAGSCKKNVLDVEPPFLTENGYFNNPIELTRGVLGVYSKLSDFYSYAGSQWASQMPVFLLPGDDITTPDADEFEIFGPLQPASGRIAAFYSTNYQVISRANAMIDVINNAPASAYTGIYAIPNLRNYHKGEVLFLRGHAFFQLWNYFGTSPLVTERVKTEDRLKQPSSTGNQLLDQAIQDFTDAATLLPASWDNANRGRVTANAAKAYLGKALVFKGSITKNNADFNAAATAFSSITGGTLVPAFDDNFAADTENNPESYFEFQASQAFASDNVWLTNDFDNAVGTLSAYWGYYDNHWSLFGRSRFTATQKYRNIFDAADPRRALSFNPANGEIRKYTTRTVRANSDVGTTNNPRILRHADALLLHAEALVQGGGSTSQAITLINQVRTRARNMVSGGTVPADFSTAETNRSTILGWIMDERLRELGGEGGRWLDLRRWHLNGAITLSNATFNSVNPTLSLVLPRHLLFPIPTSETDVNPNVTQNTGY